MNWRLGIVCASSPINKGARKGAKNLKLLSRVVLVALTLLNAETNTYAVETNLSLEAVYEETAGVLAFENGEIISLAENEPLLFVDGNMIRDANIYVDVNNAAYIPIRKVGEIFDLAFTWVPEENLITLGKGKLNEIFFSVGSAEVKTRRKNYELERPIFVYGFYTYVPLRFIMDYYGYKTEYWAKGEESGVVSLVANIISEKINNRIVYDESEQEILLKLRTILNAFYDKMAASGIFYGSGEALDAILGSIRENIDATAYFGSVSRFSIYRNANRIIYDKATGLFYFELEKDGNYFIYELSDENYLLFMSVYFSG
jgi:hypothetical protein